MPVARAAPRRTTKLRDRRRHRQPRGRKIIADRAGAPPSPPDFEGDPNNPHRRFQCNERGYVRVDVKPEAWTGEHVVIDALPEDSAGSTIATFAVEDGKAGAIRVTR